MEAILKERKIKRISEKNDRKEKKRQDEYEKKKQKMWTDLVEVGKVSLQKE